MRPRPGDVLWLVVAAMFAGLTVYYIVAIVRLFIGGVETNQAVIAVIMGIAVIAAGRWLTLGAWRRTVWGAPPGGNRAAREMRRREGGSEEA
jgi:cytochrome c biogenesis protein CcdA